MVVLIVRSSSMCVLLDHVLCSASRSVECKPSFGMNWVPLSRWHLAQHVGLPGVGVSIINLLRIQSDRIWLTAASCVQRSTGLGTCCQIVLLQITSADDEDDVKMLAYLASHCVAPGGDVLPSQGVCKVCARCVQGVSKATPSSQGPDETKSKHVPRMSPNWKLGISILQIDHALV